jgi:hypothetical protein
MAHNIRLAALTALALAGNSDITVLHSGSMPSSYAM